MDSGNDEPRTRKETVSDDRPLPGIEGGWFAGKDAVGVLRRTIWAGVAVAGLGLLLLGTVAFYLRELVATGRAIEQLLRRP